jgi:hypothetical protein
MLSAMSNVLGGHTGIFYQRVPTQLSIGDDPAEERLLSEYGAVFIARNGVIAPDRVIFKDEEDVNRFQAMLEIRLQRIGEYDLELQAVAMERLLDALYHARQKGLTITPRGADSARRSYSDTIELWKSRVEPGLVHWVGKGQVTQEEAEAIRALSPHEQVREIFELEEDGIFFAKDLSKSIIYSVAPPGASQHLSLLAFDVAEFNDPDVRSILADHMWHQTVVSDLPHFTFLGVMKDELVGLGLKRVTNADREFWVPDI